MPTRPSSPSLAAAFNPRRNALNAIRLVLASTVIFAHAWPLGGWAGVPSVGGFSIGEWAVNAFFAISGFLILRSRTRSALPGFVLRRFLRIYPAYITATIVIAFGFAPVAVMVLGEPSWNVTSSVEFVLRNLFLKILQDDIPGTVDNVPLPGVWNGSFWTLAYEFACYLLVGVLVALLRQRSVLLGGVVVGMVLCSFGALALEADVIAVPAALAVAFRPTAFFLGGAVVFLVAERLPARAWFAGAMALVLVAGAVTDLMVLLAPIPLAVLCILAGMWLRGDPLTARHDISYGVYLYGWPVGQVVAHVLVAPSTEPWAIAGVTILASVPFAVASWLLVERPTMRLAGTRRRRSGLPAPSVAPSDSTRDGQPSDERALPSQCAPGQPGTDEDPPGTGRPRAPRHRQPEASRTSKPRMVGAEGQPPGAIGAPSGARE